MIHNIIQTFVMNAGEKITMNSIERVQAAIDLKKPDRVPVDLHNFQSAAYAMGVPMQEVFKDGEMLAESM